MTVTGLPHKIPDSPQAIEAGAAVLAHARETLALPRVLGIVLPANQASVRVL